MYTVYTWTRDWLDNLLTGSSSVVESWLGSAQLSCLSIMYPITYSYRHILLIHIHTHCMQGHVRRDCVCVIYVYIWESVWQGVSRMCVYMCVECTHSPKHIICLQCHCVCEYKHSAYTECVAWVKLHTVCSSMCILMMNEIRSQV